MVKTGVINLEGDSKVALIFGQMNEPPGAHARAALTGLTIVEYFRDETTFCTPWTARRRFSTHHERSHHGTRHPIPFWSLLTSVHRINIPSPSHRHFGSLARRLGRIFAHVYFHHREVFEQAEAESALSSASSARSSAHSRCSWWNRSCCFRQYTSQSRMASSTRVRYHCLFIRVSDDVAQCSRLSP
jgi:hypothetical protein